MERLRRLLPEISELAGNRRCVRHGVEVPDERIEMLGRLRLIPGTCPQCHADQVAQLAVEDRRRAAAEYAETLRHAGIPDRYAGAALADFRIESESQRAVKAAVEAFLADGWRTSPGLLFLGSVGTGKTMLASALVSLWLERRGAGSAKLYTLLGVFRRIKATWEREAHESEAQVLKKLREVELLVVDEIGVQHGTATELVLFTDLINERYNALRPTILVGNLTVAECTKILGERVVDRFRDGGEVLSFDWSSWRGRGRRDRTGDLHE